MAFPSREIWDMLAETEVARGPFEHLGPSETEGLVRGLFREHPESVMLGQAGVSVEGRPLWTLGVGRGAMRVLAWARQHGDEPLCSAASLNALSFLCRKPGHAVSRAILEGVTILLAPLVNPDGALRFTRRNAMGVDLNRDARKAMTPEGRACLRLRDEFAPQVAFALHDMGRRKSTSTDGRLAALSLLANPYDKGNNTNEARLRAKRICGRMAEAAGAIAYGHIAHYECPWMPRAFGDTTVSLGIPTCLVETGGWFEPGADEFGARLHALAFLAGLYAVATGTDSTANAAFFDAHPFDSGRPYFDVVARDVAYFDGAGRPLVIGDFAVNGDPCWKRGAESPTHNNGVIADIGDMMEDRGKSEIVGEGLLATPGLIALAPGLRLRGAGDAERLGEYVRAGFTTVVAGCGPFGSSADFGAWKAEMTATRWPANVIAFEVVETLEKMLARGGQTDAFGLLTPDLGMTPADLLSAIHLFHPAGAGLSEKQEKMGLCVDLFLRATGHPGSNQIHLLVRAVAKSGKDRGGDGGANAGVGAGGVREGLQRLFHAFIRRPDQLTVSIDTSGPALGFFPVPPMVNGLGEDRRVEADFLARTADTLKCRDEDHLSMIVCRLTLQPAKVFGVNDAGLIRDQYRGDVAFFECRPAPVSSALVVRRAPRLGAARHVLVNGRFALRDEQIQKPYSGGLLLS